MGGADRNDDPEATGPIALSWQQDDVLPVRPVPQGLPPLWEAAETDPYAAVTVPAAAPPSASEPTAPNPITALSEVGPQSGPPQPEAGTFTTLVSDEPAGSSTRRVWRPAEGADTPPPAEPERTIDLTAPPSEEPELPPAYLVDVGFDTGPIHPPLPTYAEAAPPPPLPPIPEPLPTYPAPTTPPAHLGPAVGPAAGPPPAPGPATAGALPTYGIGSAAGETTGPLPTYVPNPAGPSDPGDGAGRHAATSPPWRRALTSGALAVGAVVVGLLTANYWHAGGYPGHPVHKAQPGPGPAVVGTAPGTSASTHAPRPTIPATHAPAPVGRPSAAAPSARLAAGTATVTVLNETGIRGLAEKEAARITAAGWHVRRTTNVNARYAVTTVLYERGQEDQARLLLRTVPSVKEMRLRPNIFLPTGGLIVVVASDAA